MAREVGFFRELWGDPERPSVLEARGRLEGWAEELAGYLDGGAWLLVAASATSPDVIAADGSSAGRMGTRTDGEWVWPAELGFYVRKHRVALDPDFVDHASRLNWTAPHVTSERLRELELEDTGGC